MKNLYKEFINWISYNFPAEKMTDFQSDILKAIFNERVPINSKELAQRLKNLLPKVRK